MVNVLKQKPGLVLALALAWGIQFFFLPSLHYHPESSHGHTGDLAPHSHDGHLHSHELESIAHFVDLHPSDPALDEKHHHPHSSPAHDSDDYEISLHKTSVKPEPSFNNFKDGENPVPSQNLEQELFTSVSVETPPAETAGPPDVPKERSPPFLLV